MNFAARWHEKITSPAFQFTQPSGLDPQFTGFRKKIRKLTGTSKNRSKLGIDLIYFYLHKLKKKIWQKFPQILKWSQLRQPWPGCRPSSFLWLFSYHLSKPKSPDISPNESSNGPGLEPEGSGLLFDSQYIRFLSELWAWFSPKPVRSLFVSAARQACQDLLNFISEASRYGRLK